MYDGIPEELKKLPQWVCVGPTKAPINPKTGGEASVTIPQTWTSFEDACRSPYAAGGIGFVFTRQDPYLFLDLDDPYNPKKNWPQEKRDALAALNRKIYDTFDSYTELSQSGNGLHIIMRGDLPDGGRRDTVELYPHERYAIMTGKVVRPLPIKDFNGTAHALYSEIKGDNGQRVVLDETTVGELDDADLVAMASRAENGAKFDRLCNGEWENEYPSQSEADFALLSIIAYYTRDNAQVRRIFRMTKLGERDKATKNDKYLNIALQKVRAQQPPEIDMEEALKRSAEAARNAREAAAERLAREEARRRLVGEASEARATAASETGEGRGGNAIPGESFGAAAIGAGPGERDADDEDGFGDFLAPETAKLAATYPPGLLGRLATYIYQSSIRPIPEAALVAAVGLMAGICGRSYNVSGSGLALYMTFIAPSGSGKEGIANGIDAVVAAVRRTVPMIDQFMGPSAFASGQGIVRTLEVQPCFVSVLGEFGYTLRAISDPKAHSSQTLTLKVLLDVYGKSGWTKALRPSAYSDKDKNTGSIQAPNVTIIGESTPSQYFDGLSEGQIAAGLIPRFLTIEYDGPRPSRNRAAGFSPPDDLVDQIATLATCALTSQVDNRCTPVGVDPGALDLYDDFDAACDQRINGSVGEVSRQLWNRAHLKALKLGALVAVCNHPYSPVIDVDAARWAIAFVERDARQIEHRFVDARVGSGDARQEADVVATIDAWYAMTAKQRSSYRVPGETLSADVVPYAFLRRRLRALASFENDRRGSSAAVKACLANMVEAELLDRVPEKVALEKYRTRSPLYLVGDVWPGSRRSRNKTA